MQTFNQHPTKELDQTIMEWLSDHSATILVLATLATFLLTGFLEFFFYREVFTTAMPTGFAVLVAIIIPTTIQFIRAATVTNSAKKWRQNQKGRGSFIMLLSLAGSIYCSFEMVNLATFWEAGREQFAGAILFTLQFLVWSGFALEIVLAVSIAGEAKTNTPPHTQQNPQRSHQQPEFDFTPLSNGNGAKH